MTRWMKDQQEPTFDSVRAVCRALALPTVNGLLAAGLLSADEIGATVILQSRQLEELHHDELLGELARRLDDALSLPPQQRATEGAGQPPSIEPPDPTRDLAVRRARSLAQSAAEGDRWAARRRPNPQ